MTNLTDLELLEAAAKAAGINVIVPMEKFSGQPDYEHIGGLLVRDGENVHSVWNAIVDDRDAFRLAVKLRLNITVCNGLTHPGVVVGRDSPTDEVEVGESYCADPYAATRRTIVRAAASLAPKD